MESNTYMVAGQTFELYHYGIKGMKWGVRKNRNAVNKSYSAKQRKQDRAFYGQGGERRINKKLNDGHGLRGARHYEAERKERKEKRQKKAKRAAKVIAGTLAKIGMAYAYDQTFNNGRGTDACKYALKGIGMFTISAYAKARGGSDIHWYDKQGRKIV